MKRAITIRLDEDIFKQLKAKADSEHRSVGATVAMMVEECLLQEMEHRNGTNR